MLGNFSCFLLRLLTFFKIISNGVFAKKTSPLFQFEIAFSDILDLSDTKRGWGRHLYFVEKTILVFFMILLSSADFL